MEKTFKYYGAHIWNLFHNDIKNSTTIDNFNLLFKSWDGPKYQSIMCNALKYPCTCLYIL